MSFLKPVPTSVIHKFILSGFLEFGPVIIFLTAYDLFHIFKATLLLMIATIVTTVITFRTQKRLPYAGLYIAFLTLVFGYLTLMHRNPDFIQVRDTVYDIINATVLIGALAFDVLLFKHAFHDVVPMTNRAWRKLTYAWASYFFIVAIANEYVRHMFPFDYWIVFKASMAVVTTVFGVLIFFIVYEKQEEQ